MVKKVQGKEAKPVPKVSKSKVTKRAPKAAEQRRLRILLVSDEHEEWAMLDRLVDKVRSVPYDIVLMSGDQANCNNRIGQKADAAENEVAA